MVGNLSYYRIILDFHIIIQILKLNFPHLQRQISLVSADDKTLK